MIREATLDDVPQLVEMSRQFRAQSLYRTTFVDNPEQLAATITGLITGPSSVMLVLTAEDRLIGMIGLLLHPHLFDAVMTAGELVWWVEPEARGSGAGVELLRAAEAWAVEKGAARIQMVAPSVRVGEFYEREGYTFIEMNYQKTLVEMKAVA